MSLISCGRCGRPGLCCEVRIRWWANSIRPSYFGVLALGAP